MAIRLRARGALVFTVGMSAYSASELLIHVRYGLRAAQGGPSHLAVMGAALLGVILGTMLDRALMQSSTLGPQRDDTR